MDVGSFTFSDDKQLFCKPGVSILPSSDPHTCLQTKLKGVTERYLPKTERASSSLRVNVAKTYRNETSLFYSTVEEGHCDLAESLHFCFVSSLYVLVMLTLGLDDALVCLR